MYFCAKSTVIKPKRNKSLIILYILFGYVFLQLVWWAYTIIELNKVIHQNPEIVHKKTMMIAGESAVFILLLFTGVYFIRKSILKELALVNEKKNFTLSVTHELKTPIASSKLFLETLINRNLPKEHEKSILKKVYNDQNRLQQLVEDILLASKLDEHKVKLYPKQINLYDFVVSTTQNMVGENNVRYNIPKDLVVELDPFYFSSVIQNLHSNAVKYSEKEIIWEAEVKGEMVYLRIKDFGNGIPKKERQNVFKLFYRMGDEDTRSSKGTGLGLYLVNKIVTLHNGKISIAENKPQGTIIEIEIQQKWQRKKQYS